MSMHCSAPSDGHALAPFALHALHPLHSDLGQPNPGLCERGPQPCRHNTIARALKACPSLACYVNLHFWGTHVCCCFHVPEHPVGPSLCTKPHLPLSSLAPFS